MIKLRLWAIFLLAVSTNMSLGSEKPNIIFLFADDQRVDTIAARGNKNIKTPNLDRLVADGFSFNRNYCAGSFSGAVCVASRAMLMTGRHWMRIPTKNKANDWQNLPLFPRLLSDSGYETYIVGKWHNGAPNLLKTFSNGKSIYMGGMANHADFEVHDLVDGKLSSKRPAGGFSSTVFADAAVDYIKNAKTDKPFFLYVAFMAPHDPRNPPEKYREMYYKNRPPLPRNFKPEHPFLLSRKTSRGRDEGLAPWPRTKEVISDQLCEYYGLVTHLDEQIGRVLKTLENSPHAKNTYIIYTADHGLAMGSHGLLGKQNIYEVSMNSPLIINGPGIPAGKSSDAFTYILDLYATICGIAGVDVPKGVDSKDLMPIIEGKESSVRDSLFLPYMSHMRSINDGRWKLHIYPWINHQLLFDLKADPDEMQNLAYDQKHAGEVKRLTELMQSWRQRLGDQDPLSVKDPQPKEATYDNSLRNLDPWQPKWIRDKYFDGRESKRRLPTSGK